VTSQSPRIYRIVRVLLALILFVAAVLKARALSMGIDLGSESLQPQWMRVASVECEFLLGFWLVSGLYPIGSWRVALAAFVAFTCISLCRGLMGYSSCGCFGALRVSPWITATMDAAFVGVLLRYRPHKKHLRVQPHWSEMLRTGAIGVGASAFGAYALSDSTPGRLGDNGIVSDDTRFVVLEPETWQGKQWPLLQHIDIGEHLAQGGWIVIIHRQTCPHCPSVVARYQEVARNAVGQANAPRISLVEMPPYASASSGEATDSSWVVGRLSDAKRWFVQTPVVVRLENGRVVSVEQGRTQS